MTTTVLTRFWTKVNKTDNCWLWTGVHNRNGYGVFFDGNGNRLAHRVSFIVAGNDIPDGLQLDHLCRVRNCVNPAHLEAVTGRENVIRGNGPIKSKERIRTVQKIRATQQRQLTHCKRGHEFTPENIRRMRFGRGCRTCINMFQRARRADRILIELLACHG